MSKVAVILPSRGLIFSQTADEILQNVKEIPHRFYFSHRKPIPQCFEEPTNRALLDDDITHLWFVEDDMILPPDTLKKLLKKDLAVVTCDYPVNKDGRGSVFKVGREVIFCGTGCMLVKREVFDVMKKPYFRTDMRWNIKNYGSYVKMTRTMHDNITGYGLHDINFCMALNKLNIPIHMITLKLGQRKLVELGKAGTNNGAHNIETWTKIEKDQLLNYVKKWPIMPSGNLTTVITDDGEITVSKEHAKKLIEKGIAKAPKKRKIIIDWNEE
jgi:hypothetical protein